MNIPHQPAAFTTHDATRIALESYGLRTTALPLPGERDHNFHLQAETGRAFVLKIAHAEEQRPVLDLQNKALEHLATHDPSLLMPQVCLTSLGEAITTATNTDGRTHFVRLLTYMPGRLLAETNPHTHTLLHSLGMLMGRMDRALQDFTHPAAQRTLKWDLRGALWIRDYVQHITRSEGRAIVERFLSRFELDVLPVLPTLRASVIHGDANDYNVLVGDTSAGSRQVVSVIDFGDMVHTYTVCELAIAAAYAMLHKADPLAAAAHVVAGYHEAFPLTGAELEVLYSLICTRLCISVVNSAYQQKIEPHNGYLTISEQPAWELLAQLVDIHLRFAHYTFCQACQLPPYPGSSALVHWLESNGGKFPADSLSVEQISEMRAKYIGKSLSISYQRPLKIVRGWMQYLYDEDGRAYLDAVNNVAHVGHCHPRVVKAGQQQMAVLNTNTRYLHDNLVRYAERLCATLPAPLSVCFFVCSGSEANELALRLARTYTGQKDMIVVDVAYHGNTTSLIEISPYKFDGPGGAGAPPYVHKVPMPDVYRGEFKRDDPHAAEKYARHVEAAVRQIQQQRRGVAAFICESLLSCAGQVVLPGGYLKEAYHHVQNAGGVCIADEVQVGFGRVGTHFWGLETQGVVPDIVTMGKPIGNGHPLAAVVTTPEIADAFNNGMEYFNTFGGNPVSCAIGMAVLDVIAEEQLQENALRVGTHLMDGLHGLMEKHPLIGDVRGLGLFVGIELVLDRETLLPAPTQASYIANRMRERGILLSTDGPFHNVLKIKPPLVFTEANADFLVAMLDEILDEDLSDRCN